MDRRQLQILTNSYEITALPSHPFFHFDVVINQPDKPNLSNPTNLSKGRNYEIIDRLILDNASIFNPRPVYDGRQNMFSRRDIPSGDYQVCMRRDRSKGPTHTVTIRRVNIIDPRDVRKLIRPRHHGDSAELNAMSLNLLQLIVRQAPNLRHRFPADARSFYVSSNSRDLRIGLSVWRGFFQSVRPTMDRLVINIDISHAAIYTPGPLLSTMLQALKLENIRDLQNLRPPDYAQLRTFLKGVYVQVTTCPNMRPKPISDLVRQAGLQEFDKDGERLTVQQHFETKYNVRVKYSQNIGVKIGKSAVIPAEFCTVIPGQVYRKKISPDAQRAFLEFATQKPDVRLAAIKQAVQDGVFDYDNSDFIRDAGMKVGANPISITGELIPPPPIMYGGDDQPMQPRAGAWNVVGKRLLRPETLKNWGVVVFDRANQQQVERFVSTLVRNMQRLGMNVPLMRPPIQYGNPANPEASLEACGRMMIETNGAAFGNPQFLLVFLPANAADCRRAVKHWGDIMRRTATQCVRAGKWERNSDQYCNNVALKINARLGGTNSSIAYPHVNSLLKETMVIGADVGHPAPGAIHRPSLTGLVASVNQDVSVMTSAASVQQPRLEIIQDLQQMMAGALNGWRQWRKNNLPEYTDKPVMPPQYIIFYRDGVSDGEFSQVTQQEIKMIKDSFKDADIPEKIWPKLLFIVVGKRHHVRFFPMNARDADKSGNCPAGLLVDKEITNPHYEDFYLQSHAGLLGTSRPSHYVILLNETGISKRNVQTLTFHLCHTYASATRSVSIPAPVYYADKICSRLEFHCADGASLSDTASNVTGATTEFDLEHWRRVFQPSGLANLNYFL